jgi:hypothetical protein
LYTSSVAIFVIAFCLVKSNVTFCRIASSTSGNEIRVRGVILICRIGNIQIFWRDPKPKAGITSERASVLVVDYRKAQATIAAIR